MKTEIKLISWNDVPDVKDRGRLAREAREQVGQYCKEIYGETTIMPNLLGYGPGTVKAILRKDGKSFERMVGPREFGERFGYVIIGWLTPEEFTF